VKRLGVMLILLIGTGCSTAIPSSPPATPPASAGALESIEPIEPPVETPTATPVPTLAAIDLPQPGHPLDPATLLGVMRSSPRPGGVPDQMETDAVAAAVAGAIWTLGGEPWTTVAAGGSCGPESCTLEVAGSRAGTPGEDLWVFAVTPATGAVEVVTAEIRSMPAELVIRLDELTRALAEAGSLDAMVLTSARWLPQPNRGLFVLSYRSGGEEGSCGIDHTVDASAPNIVPGQVVNC
jgi:hypothetical protein